MPRSIQSSHYSSSYGGSQSSSLAGRSISPGQEDDYEGDKAFGNGIMGVMYTVCKEKDKPSVVFMAFRLLADWLQLWMLVVNPAWFNIPRPALWWQILYFISLNDFISARGNTFYLACFYLLVFGLLMSVVVSLWVGASFQNNRFEYVWPIVFLRIFGKIFYQILDIMSVSLFLIALDCQYFAVPDEQRGINAELGVACWAMPHLIHAGVAVLALILFLVLASLFCMGEMELSFTTKNPLAIMHTGVEMRTFGLRMTMAFVAVFVNSLKWQSAAQLALTSYLVWLLWFWQPQMTGWVNHFRTGTYLSVWWTTLLFLLLAFGIGVDLSDDHATLRHQARLTTVMWATFFPVGLLGALASWLRLRYFHRTVLQRFRGKTSLDKPWEVYEVTDSRQVEILARCCRVWVDRDTLDPEAVLLAETVLKCGIAQRPKDPFMIVLISSFLIDVQSSYQSGYSQLQVAKRLDLNFLMRFAIFSREQQHTQRSGMSGQADDLVSYVEYTRNHALALRVHREALNSMRTVWEILLHAHVRFQTLAEAISRMDAAIKAADRVYKSVLARHLGHIQMVRLYAKFLEHVKHDPWGAAKWFAEAEKLESVEEDQKNQDAIDGLDVSDPELRAAMMSAGPLGGTGANPRCVIIINAQGQIQMTNRALLDVFGYTKAEIREKNVGLLMPPSTAAAHNTYLRNYITSGQPKILNQATEQLAMTKDRRLLPVSLMVTKISGIAEDSSFLGILEPIAPAPDTATIWVSLDGGILGVDAQFTDWFAFTSGEVHGWALSRLVTKQSKALQQCMMRARASLHSRHFLTSAQADSSMSVAKMAAAEGSAHNPSLPLGTGSVVRNVPSNHMFQLHSAPSVLSPQRPPLPMHSAPSLLCQAGNKCSAEAQTGPLTGGGVLPVRITSHTHGMGAHHLHYCLTPVT
ncbi:hypothetical protein V8C86DRAFT_516034 [Haematococcus lacustris]